MGCKHRYLWLGSYQSDELFQKMLVRNIGQASGFASQKGLIKGFDQILDADSQLDTIGMVSYPPYPLYPAKRVQRETWSRTGSSKDITIGYVDINYVTYLSRGNNLISEVKKWASDRIGAKTTTVIVYEPSVAKLKASLYLKRKYGAKIFVIIPDIPELVNLGANKIVKIGKRWAAHQMKKQFRSVDGFILYSACMAEYYHFKHKQWILMEGVFDPEEAHCLVEEEGEEHPIRLMYCGALDEFRGIPQLLDAFDQMRDTDYELWLTGAGRSEKLIQERMEKDSRIHYFGYLDSRREVLELEQKADILIHTRDLKSPAAPYCFPSKLFEYLASGKPVLSVDIPGIPREYFEYLIRIDDLSIDSIKKAIHKGVSLTKKDRDILGNNGKQFVLTHKISSVQATKINDFILGRLQGE